MDTTVFTAMAMVILMARLKKPTIRVIGIHPTPSFNRGRGLFEARCLSLKKLACIYGAVKW